MGNPSSENSTEMHLTQYDDEYIIQTEPSSNLLQFIRGYRLDVGNLDETSKEILERHKDSNKKLTFHGD